ncbi:hypothetical protein JAAARDRAFT_35750 [Jaapia argillacea MUCL 33604]|uniref:F-box domain-containing protein n=1 Tax=Jaapia argillacea MUCL 33604 TaxID=933084 RepID=A0A067PTH7_9AGAM|nr:hypothetical protein JAAARDRAFT_35750 [Jaapia argillacea MUCL 33604]
MLFDTLKVSIVLVTAVTRWKGLETRFLLWKSLPSSIDRLQHFASSRMCASVKRCDLKVESPGFWDALGNLEDGGLDVVKKFFELLTSFPNLATLSLTALTLDPLKLQRVSEIHTLQTLIIHDCRLPRTFNKLSIRDLEVSGNPTEMFPASKEDYGLASFFDLNQVERLQVSKPTWGDPLGLFCTQSNSPISFSNMKVLSMPWTLSLSPTFPSLLTQCPVLEELRLFSQAPKTPSHSKFNQSGATTLHPSVAPHLKIFIGPDVCASTFTSRSLRTLVMASSEGRPHDIRKDVLPILTDIAFPGDLERLAFGVDCLSDPLLDYIAGSFKSLKNLSIFISMVDGERYSSDIHCRKMWISRLSSRLPSTLIRFDISTRFAGLNHSEDVSGEDLNVLMTPLSQRCKKLTAFTMSYQSAARGRTWAWRRSERTGYGSGQWVNTDEGVRQ